jgi:hypothetical protein
MAIIVQLDRALDFFEENHCLPIDWEPYVQVVARVNNEYGVPFKRATSTVVRGIVKRRNSASDKKVIFIASRPLRMTVLVLGFTGRHVRVGLTLAGISGDGGGVDKVLNDVATHIRCMKLIARGGMLITTVTMPNGIMPLWKPRHDIQPHDATQARKNVIGIGPEIAYLKTLG